MADTSSATDRLTAIQNIYNDALNNEPQDLAKATTPALVAKIQANVANARTTYYAAEAAALANSGSGVESAYNAAKTALAAVKQARTNSAEIATLLGVLNGATAAATNLLKAAG